LQVIRQVRTRLPRTTLSRTTRARQALLGVALAPGSCLLARAIAVPGSEMHQKAFVLGTKLLIRALWTRSADLFLDATRMLRYPLDTFRYYELHLINNWLRAGPVPQRYLDISSPRLLPIALLDEGWATQSVLLNPDRSDLGRTKRIADALGLSGAVDFSSCTVQELPLDDGGFDTITCVSVIEHIEDDTAVVPRIWESLNLGGSAYLSVPCAARGYEELIDFNEYGLVQPDEDGFVFGQRFYDARMLEDRLFSIMGRPSRIKVVGESTPGLFFENREAGAKGGYDHWKEPLLVKRGIHYFGSVQELPGVGVVVMEFRKGSGLSDNSVTGG
jgi:SAM-dependent methyltransferase